MKLQNVLKRGRLRHILLALAAFLFFFHSVTETLHAASHTAASQECALCKIAQTGVPPPAAPVVLPQAPTITYSSPATPWVASHAPIIVPALSHPRGPPTLS